MNQLCLDISNYNKIPNKYTSFIPSFHPHEYQCPPEVTKNMSRIKYGIQYNSEINGVQINIKFFTTFKCNCIDYFHIVMTMLRLMMTHQFKNIQLDFIFTDVKKTLPTSGLIGPSTLNTGYTIGNQVVVYREEEWLKVCIHECIHLFLYDEALRDNTMLVYSMFPISKSINLNESYCELWARILNCCIISVVNNIPIKTLLIHEQQFSIEQMCKVLQYMNLNYEDLWNSNTKYEENTNAFAYLVIPAILIQDAYEFVDWCNQNDSLFYISKQNIKKYVQLIEHKYKQPSWLNKIHNTKISSDNYTRMTINNLHL
jgi:hypothetical protein